MAPALFRPPGFGAKTLATPLGTLVYYQSPQRPLPPPPDCPPLVFFHGLGAGSSAFEWSKIYPAFSAQHRVFVPEFVGWGASAHPRHCYTLGDYGGQMQQILETVVQEPAWVVAASLTGGLAIRLACQQPHLFRGLALVSPSGYGDFGSTYGRSGGAKMAQWPGIDRALYGLASQPWAIALVVDRLLLGQPQGLSPRDRAEIHRAYGAAAAQPDAAIAALATLRGDLCFDLAQDLPLLQVPTVLLWGEQARASPVTIGQRLAQLNPQAIQSLTRLPDLGMLPHLERPSAVLAWLRSAIHPSSPTASL